MGREGRWDPQGRYLWLSAKGPWGRGEYEGESGRDIGGTKKERKGGVGENHLEVKVRMDRRTTTRHLKKKEPGRSCNRPVI